MDLSFPYQIGTDGRTATTDRAYHIRDLIRQVLFTIPGERVNRPTFGTELNQLLFEPNRAELVSTVQFLVKGALHEWMSDVIEVIDINIEVEESTLHIQINYREIASSVPQEASFIQHF